MLCPVKTSPLCPRLVLFLEMLKEWLLVERLSRRRLQEQNLVYLGLLHLNFAFLQLRLPLSLPLISKMFW